MNRRGAGSDLLRRNLGSLAGERGVTDMANGGGG